MAAAAGMLWANGASARACGTVIVPTGLGVGPPSAVASLHPVLLTGSTYELQLLNLLYRPLIWVGDGPSVDWADSLASGVAVSADDTVFTVTLKDYDWSDGTKVTASDVLYDWALIREIGHAYSEYGIGDVPEGIRSVTAPDAHHVRFEMTGPVNPDAFELAGLSLIYALPRQAWGRYDVAQQETLQSETSFYQVVDGPFHLTALTLGRYASFAPNDRYGGHRAEIRRLVVDFLEGTDPLTALSTGQVDMANLSFDLFKAADTIKGVRRVKRAAAAVSSAITPNLANPNDPFFRDVRVRQAIARAIDQPRLVDVIYHGQAMVQAGAVFSSQWRLLPPDLRDGRSPLSYDPAAARQLLDEAGWRMGGDGVRVKDGRRLAFVVTISAGSEDALMFLQLVQEDLAKVGVSISITQLAFNQLLAKMLGPPTGWDAMDFAYSGGFPDLTQFYGTGAHGNFEGYSDATMDRKLEAASREPTLAGLYEAEDYAVRQQPVFFLPDGFATVLTRGGIENVQEFLLASGLWSPEYLRLSGAEACDAAHA